MRQRNLALWGLVSVLLAAAPARADVIPPTREDIEESQRRMALPLCPEGADASPIANVECVPAARCSSTEDCEAGDCRERSLCLAAPLPDEQGGARPVLGVCTNGACPFGECVTSRRCSGSAETVERRELRALDRFTVDVFGDVADQFPSREGDTTAPTPMADPDTELPDPPTAEPPAADPDPPTAPASSGCGCRVSGPPRPAPIALLLGLVLTRSARRRRSRASRRRTAA